MATLIGRKFHVSNGVSGAIRPMPRLGFTPGRRSCWSGTGSTPVDSPPTSHRPSP
ncbi:hypothetical protein EH183_41310 [Streptomyces sp. CB01881]|nr:hypothetical protein EH183_41310 [Streptomyces sp. CB01881]